MGRVIAGLVKERADCTIIAGIDKLGEQYDEFPVYTKVFDMPEKPDVIIDFSHPSALPDLLSYGKMNNVPLVLATTGFTDEERAQITAASAQVPVFFTFNMSLGINLLVELARKATQILGGQFDIEIVEKHHNQKLDAPSGTAIMLADAVASALPYKAEYVYDRHERREKRPAHEIGISAVRGGKRRKSASARSAAAPSLVSTACCSAAAARSSRSSTPRFPVRFSRLALSMQPSTWRPARSPACMI